MSRVRVHNIGVSLDGFATGEGQSLEAPFGHAGARLMSWFFTTSAWREMNAITPEPDDPPPNEVDSRYAARWGEGVGVEIMGRNKFGPQRGPWADESWQGWWGDEPPFHTPVIVLTHHPRPTLSMAGGTVFHFLDAPPADALARARELAGGLDVRIGGGPSTIREFLAQDLVDELHVVIVPIVLGRGERLWDDLEGLEARFDTVTAESSTSGVTHVVLSR